MKEIIDYAINELRVRGINPAIIALTEKDYDKFQKECKECVDVIEKEDWMDGYVKKIEHYKGIEIETRMLDDDEANKIHPMLKESYIASSNKIMGINCWIPKEPLTGKIRDMIPVEKGRMFNLRTLKEFV